MQQRGERCGGGKPMQSDSGEKARLGKGCPGATDEGTCEQCAEIVVQKVEVSSEDSTLRVLVQYVVNRTNQMQTASFTQNV